MNKTCEYSEAIMEINDERYKQVEGGGIDLVFIGVWKQNQGGRHMK